MLTKARHDAVLRAALLGPLVVFQEDVRSRKRAAVEPSPAVLSGIVCFENRKALRACRFGFPWIKPVPTPLPTQRIETKAKTRIVINRS